MNYRSHRKALVVDGQVAFVGGMGIADQWLHDTTRFPRWRDTQIELHGPAVGDVEAAFNQNWILTGGVVDPEVPPEGPPPKGPARSIVVWSSPQGGANELKLLYLLALAAAREQVDIQSPYLITDESSQWSLQEARQRGVRIRMLVEGDKTDAKTVKYASRADYEHLLEMGIEIAEYQPTMMHTKAMTVDGRLSIVGSANFDNRSLELNDELNVAVFDAALAARLRADFERDLQQSKKLTSTSGARARFRRRRGTGCSGTSAKCSERVVSLRSETYFASAAGSAAGVDRSGLVTETPTCVPAPAVPRGDVYQPRDR